MEIYWIEQSGGFAEYARQAKSRAREIELLYDEQPAELRDVILQCEAIQRSYHKLAAS